LKRTCCEDQAFVRHQDPEVADIGHAEGVEFTIGRCSSCQSPLMHLWVAGGISHGIEVIETSLIDQLVQTSAGKGRKKLLADWWNALR
jgi:hypothetical protein